LARPERDKDLACHRPQSKILCKRHNEALAGLDAMAGKFFSTLKLVFDDIFDKKTPSRSSKWFLFSGEEIELCMLKTAIGLFHSGVVAKENLTLNEEQAINPECYDILYARTLPRPCGIHIEQSIFRRRRKFRGGRHPRLADKAWLFCG
jgi:hypothetical protein